MTLTLDIKDSAIDKIIYFLNHLKDDVKILDAVDNNIEPISVDDSDYKMIVDARVRRGNGEKCYPLDEIVKDFK